MSSFPNHGLHTFLLTNLVLPLWAAILCGFAAMYPDVRAIPETSKLYIKLFRPGATQNWDGLYRDLHTWHGWKRDWWKWVIFPIGFHVFVIDKLTHKAAGGWNVFGWISEFAFWLFILYLIIW